MKRLLLVLLVVSLGNTVHAETVRIATFNAALTRKGPGILLKDILAGNDSQIQSVARIVKTVRPDILLVNELDHDYENLALIAFLDVLASNDGALTGISYPYFYAPPQNSGRASGLDLNGDGRLGGPADAFGFGYFRGQYAMALVSRFPIIEARDYSDVLWKQVPGAQLPLDAGGAAFPSVEAQNIMKLSSRAHWAVDVELPDGHRLQLLASHPTPPVFDGPEDLNGKRNRDEILFWVSYIERELNAATDQFVVLGSLNSDPADGDSIHSAINTLTAHPLVQDPTPASNGGVVAAKQQGGANRSHKGDPSLDTSDWRDEPGPGSLRVDYVLPSASLNVTDAGVFWPAPGEEGFELIGSDGRASSDHRLVWVDLE